MGTRGIHHVGIAVADLDSAVETYQRLFGAELEHRETVPDQGVEAVSLRVGTGRIELLASLGPDTPVGKFLAKRGPGVHHVAFRTPDETQYHAWAQHLTALRIPNSGEIDRFYFRSLYFREPNGILFEIASDGPGFAADEPMEKLGERLALPPFLEPRRAEIEAGLRPI